MPASGEEVKGCVEGRSRKKGEPSLEAETAPGAGAALPLRDEP